MGPMLSFEVLLAVRVSSFAHAARILRHSYSLQLEMGWLRELGYLAFSLSFLSSWSAWVQLRLTVSAQLRYTVVTCRYISVDA